jgi:hypothetical protein
VFERLWLSNASVFFALSPFKNEKEKIMNTLILIVVLVLLFGGGGGYYWTRGRR